MAARAPTECCFGAVWAQLAGRDVELELVNHPGQWQGLGADGHGRLRAEPRSGSPAAARRIAPAGPRCCYPARPGHWPAPNGRDCPPRPHRMRLRRRRPHARLGRGESYPRPGGDHPRTAVRRVDHNISVAVEVVEAGGPLASAGMVSGAGCGAGNDPAVAAPRTVLTLTSLCRRPTMLVGQPRALCSGSGRRKLWPASAKRCCSSRS
jgi:hypothetical protein